MLTAIGTAVVSLTLMNYLSDNNKSEVNLNNISNQSYSPNNNIAQNTQSNLVDEKLNTLLFKRSANYNANNITIDSNSENKSESITDLNENKKEKSLNKNINLISESTISNRNNYFNDILFANNNSTISNLSNRAVINNIEEFQSLGKLPLSFSVRGMMNLSSFPEGTKSTINTNLSNFTLSVGYNLADDIKIGIEGGRQSIRYYTFENGKGENATQRETIDWAGAYIRKTFNEISNSNITPFAQGTLGATVSGPTGRLIAGLKWQPENSISLSAGLEGSTFFYQKSNVWGSISALGFIYQVEINY
jgi:hypothetical protein